MASQVAAIKRVKGVTPLLIVDGFNFCDPRCSSYFLTHYHADHTTGLHAAFDLGQVYCTEVTKRLLVHHKGVAEKVRHKGAVAHHHHRHHQPPTTTTPRHRHRSVCDRPPHE